METKKVILHIDMNSYFASVEQQANPLLRGKPVGVCAYVSENGCIIASSMEAKVVGIGTGSRVRDARKKYPNTILVQNDPPKYRTITKKIFGILNEYTTHLEPYSIDEAFLDITAITVRRESNPHKQLDVARNIGEEINNRIKQEVGGWLKCSIGISRTRFLAKLLSDTALKDSTVSVEVSDVPQVIAHLELTDIWGINRRLESRFNNSGVYTPLDLYEANPSHVLRTLHRPGYFLWAGLRGREVNNEVAARGNPKSIGHSYCLPKKTTDKKYLAQVLMKLCEKTGRRLRERNFDAQLVRVYWGYVRGGGDYGSTRVYAPLYDSIDIFKYAWHSLQDTALPNDVRMLAVSVTDFVPPSNQMNLFTNIEQEHSKKRSLLAALDAVNNKYGEYAIMRGAMWGTEKNAPDRIGFRKTVSWEE